MKYAFLVKNFNHLSFEEKTIFLAHLGTAVSCLFPWFSASPLYGESISYLAFFGPGFLIGFFIFLISMTVSLFFVDKILETKKFKSLTRNLSNLQLNYLFVAAGVEQIVFLVLMWSVLLSVGNDFGESEIRFGIFMAFLAQVVGLTAAFLAIQNEKQKAAKSFFSHPERDNVVQKVHNKKDEKASLFNGVEKDGSNDDNKI